MKYYILVLIVLSLSTFSANCQDKKVAILETIPKSDGVSAMIINMITGELTKTISLESGYTALSRTDVDRIVKEMKFQSSGFVNDSEIAKLGEMSGAQYVCISEVTTDGSSFYIEGRLINIESGEIEQTATSYINSTSSSEINKYCRKLGKELLYGQEMADRIFVQEEENKQEQIKKTTPKKTYRQKPNHTAEGNFIEYCTETLGNFGLTYISTNSNGWGYYFGGKIGWRKSLSGDDGKILIDTHYTTGEIECGFFTEVSIGGIVTLSRWIRLYGGVAAGYFRIAEEVNTTFEYSWAINSDNDEYKAIPEGGIILFNPDIFMLKYGVSYNKMPYNTSGLVHNIGFCIPLD